MKFAYYIKKENLSGDPRITDLLDRLQAGGVEVYRADSAAGIIPGTDGLLSLGGDGTFLTGAKIAVQADIPILGVNFGRLGFLSEASPEDLPQSILKGELAIEERELLQVLADDASADSFWPYALNETSISRDGASMLGIDVRIDGDVLPTYWADGLIVATSSGSTAYALSVGGPICMPDSKVFIVAPISPHNLNVRPLVVPQTARIEISLRSREGRAVFSIDNRNRRISSDTRIIVSEAPVRLKRFSAGKSTFINALRTRLLWGEDVRNGNEVK